MPLQDASVLFDRISDLHLAPKCMQIKRQIGTQEGQVEPEANGVVAGTKLCKVSFPKCSSCKHF